MVKAPMCKVCGSPHFGSTHVWPDKTPAPKSFQPPADEAAKPIMRDSQARRESPAVGIAEARSMIGSPTPPKRDRAAYMRDYRAGLPKETRDK